MYLNDIAYTLKKCYRLMKRIVNRIAIDFSEFDCIIIKINSVLYKVFNSIFYF